MYNYNLEARDHYYRAYAAYWEATGYRPMGSRNPYYHGPQRDMVDAFLEFHKGEENDPAWWLDIIRRAIDLAIRKEELEDHPDLEAEEQKYIQICKERGIQELPHVDYTLVPDKNYQPTTFMGMHNAWGEKPPRTAMKKGRNEKGRRITLDAERKQLDKDLRKAKAIREAYKAKFDECEDPTLAFEAGKLAGEQWEREEAERDAIKAEREAKKIGGLLLKESLGEDEGSKNE